MISGKNNVISGQIASTASTTRSMRINHITPRKIWVVVAMFPTTPNNPLLRVATWSALAMALAGAWLLLWSFPRRRKKKA